MKKFLHLIDFQVKEYVKNTYFVNLVLIQTTMMMLYEYLTHYVHHNYSGQEWLIAGVIGLWASCTTSGGALGFQRFQGTLPHLLNGALPPFEVLLATLAPAAIYGLVAFPLAALEALILGMPINYLSWELLLGIVVLWFTATVLSYVVSLIFVLSKHAMQYEELLLLPILLLSGFLTIPSVLLPYLEPLQLLSPLTLPIQIIYHQTIKPITIIFYFLIIILFILSALKMTHVIVQRAIKENRLEIF